MQSDLITKARLVAELVHARQADKSGNQYVDHPRRVAQRVPTVPDFASLNAEQQEAAICAAWLHDVLEDSGTNGFPVVLKSDLIAWGFSKLITTSVEVLSRSLWVDRLTQQDKPKAGYYTAVGASPICKIVKLADIADNCNEERMNKVAEPKRSELIEKYRHARETLGIEGDLEAWFAADIKKLY